MVEGIGAALQRRSPSEAISPEFVRRSASFLLSPLPFLCFFRHIPQKLCGDGKLAHRHLPHLAGTEFRCITGQNFLIGVVDILQGELRLVWYFVVLFHVVDGHVAQVLYGSHELLVFLVRHLLWSNLHHTL